MQAVCPTCDELNPVSNQFCGSCGASLDSAQVVKEAVRSPDEITYYSDESVQISSTRAVFGAKTYALANITSVAMGIMPPRRTLSLLLVIAGLIVFVVGLLGARSGEDLGIAVLSVGVVVTGVGIYLAARAKPKYKVKIASASAETEALVSPDRDYIEQIIAALHKAIVARG